MTRVNVVQYPTENPKDVEINNHALPILAQETIDAQSADIDMSATPPSQATATSSPKQSALDQAGL